jgi:hypothetical protein
MKFLGFLIEFIDNRLKRKPTGPIDPEDDVMTLNEFVANVVGGGFIDYDGYGHYSDGKSVFAKIVYPSDVKNGRIDRSFSHVVWYNR